MEIAKIRRSEVIDRNYYTDEWMKDLVVTSENTESLIR